LGRERKVPELGGGALHRVGKIRCGPWVVDLRTSEKKLDSHLEKNSQGEKDQEKRGGRKD